MSKVFGIGFHKTGTSSLGAALEILGYEVCHGASALRRELGAPLMIACLQLGKLEPVFRVAERFEAFEDNPWCVIFRELDQRFPGSRFILTHRDEDRWLASAVRYFGQTESGLRRWIYGAGTPVGHEGHWVSRYRRHNEEVRAYFADRPGDLLVVDWEQGAGWSEVCAFLGRAVPDQPFPHVRPTRRPKV